jgi:hypothetical protein
MADDPNRPVVLVTVPTELKAALIVAALSEQGIEAQTIGELTSAFRAEVPGGVSILVRHADLERARLALQAMEGGQSGSKCGP